MYRLVDEFGQFTKYNIYDIFWKKMVISQIFGTIYMYKSHLNELHWRVIF